MRRVTYLVRDRGRRVLEDIVDVRVDREAVPLQLPVARHLVRARVRVRVRIGVDGEASQLPGTCMLSHPPSSKSGLARVRVRSRVRVRVRVGVGVRVVRLATGWT